MFAVFDTIRSRGIGGMVLEKKVLKLICGGDQIELIELDNLRYQASVDADRCRSQLLPDDLRHVILIVKSPLLALRYQLPDGRIRRIQMNFRPASGCDIAFETLKATGIVVVYKDRPPHAPQPLQLPAQSSQNAESESQPRSSQEQQARLIATTSNHSHLPPSAQPSQLRPHSSQAVLSSLQPPFRDHQNHFNNEHIPLPQSVSHGSLHGSLDNSQPRSQEYNFINYGTPSSRQPPQTQSCSSCPGNGGHPDDFSKPIVYIQDPRSQVERSSSTNNPCYTGPGLDRSSFSSAMPQPPAQHGLPLPPPGSRNLLPSPNFDNYSSAFGGFIARPVSAPEVLSDSQLMDSLPISQMLPPQRVLPFPDKPTSRETEDTPASSADPGTLKKPRSRVNKARKGPTSAKTKPSLVVSQPSSSASNTRSRKAKQSKPQQHEGPPSSAPPSKRTLAHTIIETAPSSSAPPRVDSTLEALEQTVTKITKDLTPPSSRSGIDRSPLSAMNDGQTNQRPPLSSTSESSPTAETCHPGKLPEMPPDIRPGEYLDAVDEWIRKYHGLPTPAAPKTAKEQLADYVAKPDEERAKIINEKILECLQDENFGKLCDDVERSWKRICLGF